MTQTEPFVPTLGGSAYHIEPDPTKPARSTTAAFVPDLMVTLVLEAGRTYTVETRVILAVEPAAGQTIAFAPTLRDETTALRAPWTEHTEPTYVMLRTEHHFRGITGTGRPLTVRVALRSSHGPAAIADGVLTAIAIAELPPLTVIPGCGPLVTLAGGPFPPAQHS